MFHMTFSFMAGDSAQGYLQNVRHNFFQETSGIALIVPGFLDQSEMVWPYPWQGTGAGADPDPD